MLIIVQTLAFQADLEQALIKEYPISKLKTVIRLIAQGVKLPRSYRNHNLHGKWSGFRELHIEPDWLLIYLIEGEKLHLVRLGSHEALFD